jgi:hypothetical protein
VIFSIPMAIEDFVPVLLGGIAFFVLGDVVTREHAEARRLAWVGATLVTLGGTAKATWKLVMAVSQGALNLVVLDEALFFLLASGFICLSVAFAGARRSSSRPSRVALPLVAALMALSLALALRGVASYRILLIAAVAIASTVTLVTASIEARRRGAPLASALIAVYLLATFALQAIARQERSTAQQWTAQLLNTAGVLCLLVGSLIMRRRARRVSGAGANDDLSALA